MRNKDWNIFTRMFLRNIHSPRHLQFHSCISCDPPLLLCFKCHPLLLYSVFHCLSYPNYSVSVIYEVILWLDGLQHLHCADGRRQYYRKGRCSAELQRWIKTRSRVFSVSSETELIFSYISLSPSPPLYFVWLLLRHSLFRHMHNYFSHMHNHFIE